MDNTQKKNLPKQKRSEITRQKILSAAHELFSEKGYHSTNITEIASRAGVSIGGLYGRYSDKLEIFYDVIKVVNRRGECWFMDYGYCSRVLSFAVNAIEHVIIPRTENTIKYINSELDELDREEFYRLKKVMYPCSVFLYIY